MANLNIIGNIQDSVSTLSGVNRKYIFNSGGYDAKTEMWSADLLEVIEEVVIPEGGFNYLCTSEGDRILTSLGEQIITN